MPQRESSSAERLTLFFLHFLGGSAREWALVRTYLDDRFHLVAIDLPGFGDAAGIPGYAVADMADYVARIVRAEAPRRWMIVGHSMGAKVAVAVARRIEDGDERGLAGLEGLILVAGSPPNPEPMDEAQRTKMMGWFGGDRNSNVAEAREYISSNSEELAAALSDAAIADVLRADRAAWLAWLQSGSREDWSAKIGVLQTPALVIAGANDEALGPEAQRQLTAPHFAHVRLETVAGVKHLIPLESPAELAALIAGHAASVGRHRDDSKRTIDAYRALIASNRVGDKSREALEARDTPDDPAYEPVAMDGAAFATLRAVVERVIPQAEPLWIDLAARIDKQLAAAVGDGWRFAALPADAQAYRIGLGTLNETARREHRTGFVQLDAGRQDAILADIADGRLDDHSANATVLHIFDSAQMRAWFEDLRADAVKAYMSHPATLARMGYSGIANGGDGSPKSGFARVALGEREPWEPLPIADFAS